MEYEEIFTWSRGVRRLTSLTGDDSTRCTPNVYTGKLYTFIFFGVDVSQATSTLTNSSARKKNQSDMSNSFVTPWTIDCRLLYPQDFLGKSTRMGCHFLLQGTILTQGLNPCLLCLLHCRLILYHWAIREAHDLWRKGNGPEAHQFPFSNEKRSGLVNASIETEVEPEF